MKRPYTFPARSRAAMTSYLSAHGAYHPMFSWNGGFALAWNIKCYGIDTSGKHSDFHHTPAWDDEWSDYAEANSAMLFDHACEDALSFYLEDEWSNYPGIEQGEWKFGVNGRSGGYLVLTDAPAWTCRPKGWASCRMTWCSRDDYADWLAGLDFNTLKRFYRAVRVLDSDLSKANQAKAMAYQYARMRNQWEEERLEVLDERATAMAESMLAARPDMYEGDGP